MSARASAAGGGAGSWGAARGQGGAGSGIVMCRVCTVCNVLCGAGPQLQPVLHGDGGGQPGQQGDHHVEARGLGAAGQRHQVTGVGSSLYPHYLPVSRVTGVSTTLYPHYIPVSRVLASLSILTIYLCPGC